MINTLITYLPLVDEDQEISVEYEFEKADYDVGLMADGVSIWEVRDTATNKPVQLTAQQEYRLAEKCLEAYNDRFDREYEHE